MSESCCMVLLIDHRHLHSGSARESPSLQLSGPETLMLDIGLAQTSEFLEEVAQFGNYRRQSATGCSHS